MSYASLMRKLDSLPRDITRNISDELEAGASKMHSLAVRRIQKNSGSGRVYVRGGVSHTASAPGEYPNTDKGSLVASMGWRSTSSLSSEFYARAVHARYLEFGTSRMRKRPFMRPTFRELRPEISKRVARAVREALRSASYAR